MQCLRKRGQAAVEYVVLMIFLLGFIIAAALPALRENELNQALAITRQVSAEYMALNSSLYMQGIRYQKDVNYNPPKINFILDIREYQGGQPPVEINNLKATIVERICLNAPDQVSGFCCTSGNYQYCVS